MLRDGLGVAGRFAVAAGLVVFRFGRGLAAADNSANGRSQRLDFFLGMDESRDGGACNGMRPGRRRVDVGYG
ncbi:hypothetical protein [Burkholderia latens]|uniref:hypothetical protein n=1 Tax=Burkholderia latens TaxID=488446 RepID=UPI001FC7CC1F|nr:hypothetical protein [Burkholderia latens]